MKVKEFIELFEKLGYDENTDLMCGTYDLNGDWYEFNFEVEDDDRKFVVTAKREGRHIHDVQLVREDLVK